MTHDECEAHFAALSEHLHEVRPIFDDFCAAHSFVYVPKQALGSYPRIRITRPGLWRPSVVESWFDLWMEADEQGQRFEKFRRDLPYGLHAGSYVDVHDAPTKSTRYGLIVACFTGKPFDQVGTVLRAVMEEHLPTLEKWDLQYLKENGRRTPLPPVSPR